MSVVTARELADYQDEPAQLPSGSFGKNAMLKLGFTAQAHRSVLSTLQRRAPLIVQQALYWDEALPGLPCVQIISNAGGILQGDRNTIQIEMGAGAQAHVTTQSATRIHEMDANYATQMQELTLRRDSYLEYLPHPVIPHRHSRFLQRTSISIDPSATLLCSEVVMPGRKYYRDGEVFEYDLYSASVHASRPDGSPLFVEKYILAPLRASLARLGVMDRFHVFGNVLILTPPHHADRLLAAMPPGFDSAAELAWGTSRLPHEAGLICKILGMHASPVREAVRRIWSLVRSQVLEAGMPERFLWA